MAIGGGACSAYRCSFNGNALQMQATTILRSECVRPAQAVELLRSGQTVLVAGSDMHEVRVGLNRASEDI